MFPTPAVLRIGLFLSVLFALLAVK